MAVFLLAVVTMAYCLLGRRLSGTILTAPMVFIGMGYGYATWGGMEAPEARHLLHSVAEIALILLLFLDAARTHVTSLRVQRKWPARMLLIGLPLSILLGTLVIAPLVPDWPLAAAALAAAILAPTDAALGQAVISNQAVPEKARQALTVESGLNDGLALPIILALASLAEGLQADAPGYWLWFAVQQIGLGPVAGVGLGAAGAWALAAAQDRGLTEVAYEGIAAIALAVGCYVLADAIGGNGFIAAFTGGLTFGHLTRGRTEFIFEFTENEGQMLAWAAFFMIGLGLMPDAVAALTWPMVWVIAASLFIVRPLAIWVSLIGTGADARTRLFFGWFGPRGLATALFALLVVPGVDPEQATPVLTLAVNAVWISALLHGITAAPGARAYGRAMRGK